MSCVFDSIGPTRAAELDAQPMPTEAARCAGVGRRAGDAPPVAADAAKRGEGGVGGERGVAPDVQVAPVLDGERDEGRPPTVGRRGPISPRRNPL